MANVLRIKRRASGGAGAPASLKNAELAFNEVDKVLWYGFGDDGSGNATSIISIAGMGAFVALTGTQTVAGDKTFSSPVTVATPTASGHAATKAYVDGLVASASIPDGDKGDITVSSSGTVWSINSAELQAIASLTSAANKITRFTGAGTADLLDFSTDGTLAANSDTTIASQKALKTYVDGLLAANDAMVFKGVIDASANPNYPAANAGHTYRVSVAGKIGGASGPNVEVGDILICTADGTASGTHATVGANWAIIQTNIDGALTTASIGSTVQAYHASLQSISGLSTSANQGIYTTASNTYATYSLTAGGRALAGVAGTANTFPYFSAANTVTLASITSAGLALLSGADAAAQRTSLGLGTMATQNANAVAITGGTIDGVVLDGGTF